MSVYEEGYAAWPELDLCDNPYTGSSHQAWKNGWLAMHYKSLRDSGAVPVRKKEEKKVWILMSSEGVISAVWDHRPTAQEKETAGWKSSLWIEVHDVRA